MQELFILGIIALAAYLMYRMYKIDKARRDREKFYEDEAKREKRNRMRGFGGKSFWDDED